MNVPDGITVVGAGLAGVAVCEELRARGFAGRLSLVGEETHLPYDRPPLSKEFLIHGGPDDTLLIKPESWYDDNEVDLELGVPVTGIRTDSGDVVMAGGRARRTDVVVLATGGRPRALPVPGGGCPALLVLRTLEDARRLRERLTAGARLAVVGGGLIGAEVAAAASTLGCEVTVVEPARLPLEHIVGTRIAAALHDRHRANGVRVIGATVEQVVTDGGGVALGLDDGTQVRADVAVVGIGIDPHIALAAAAGLRTGSGVVVDARQRTSQAQVFAVGDVARAVDAPAAATGHWHAARSHAASAAAEILGEPAPPPRAPYFWSTRYGDHLEVAGTPGEGEFTVARGDLDDGSVITFAVRDGVCVGAVAVNRSKDMAAARRLVERSARLDPAALADACVDLRTLVPTAPRPVR